MASITSLGIGSGMDLNGLLEQLKSAERQQLVPIVQQQKSYEATLSAYGKLESGLSALQDAVGKIGDDDFFASVTSEVTGSNVTATASSGAVPGSYEVDVTQLAEAYSIATDGVASKSDPLASGDGNIRFTFGDGSTADVAITDQSSLTDIRNAINDQDIGVSASIVYDGSAYRLSLASEETGTDAAIGSIDFQNGVSSLTLDATTEQLAQDASLSVNGVAITSQSNRVEDAIQGVTLDLVEAGSSTVDVVQDDEAIKEGMTEFVDAYNSLKSTIDDLSAYNGEDEAAGQLLGDSTLRTVESRLRNVLSEAMSGEGGTYEHLYEVGIDIQLDGTLSIDDEKLDEVLATDAAGLSEFFTENTYGGGLAGKLDATLDGMLKTDGLMDVATEGAQAGIDRQQERYDRAERTIEATIERYRQQFGQMDSMVAQMNQTSSYLAQQLSGLSAMLGQS
ncbi:flagellar filament capping protein FliD [Halomonas organivorans]